MQPDTAEPTYGSPNWNNQDWWDDFYSHKIEDWEAKSYSERDASQWHFLIGHYTDRYFKISRMDKFSVCCWLMG
jgi:hypothetical protein